MVLKRKNAFAFAGFLAILLFAAGCNHERKAPSREKDVLLEIFVADSVGGPAVEGSLLEVFDAGTKIKRAETYISGREVYVSIPPNKKYDFVLDGKKGKWAGSKVLNYYIGNSRFQYLSLIQPPHGMITRGITPPEIAAVRDKSSGREIKDGFEITDSVTAVTVDFKSFSGAVEPVALAGFGAKIAIGSVPNFSNGITGSYTPSVFKDGVFSSTYEFRTDKENIKLPEGESEIVIVAYDTANNRVEKHIQVKCSQNLPDISLGKTAFFNNLRMFVEKFPYSVELFSAGAENGINTFALPPPDKRNSAYVSGAVFELKKHGVLVDIHVPITGFDILRREKGNKKFKPVTRKLYSNLTSAGIPSVHEGFDSDSSMKEDTEYEYKIEAFNTNGKIQSPVMTAKLMPAFTYKLFKPEKFKQFTEAEAENISYSCKIYNQKIFIKGMSDYMDAGLIVADKQQNPQFGAKFRYVFDSGNGRADVLIRICGAGRVIKTQSLNEMIAEGKLAAYGVTKLEDLITLEKNSGTLIEEEHMLLTMTPKFVKIPAFNVLPAHPNLPNEGLNRPLIYKYGAAYEWDIQAEWGNPFRTDDDEALRIVKVFEFDNKNGGKGHVYCRSFGNNKNSGGNAINGRFGFSITK